MEKDFRLVLEKLCDPDFDDILILCHQNPDGDAAGSSHALCRALQKAGKRARVFCRDPFPKEFFHITEPLEVQEFEPRHFVSVDVADPALLGEESLAEKIEIAVDHHLKNTLSAPLKWVDASSASCAEMVLKLIREMPVEMDLYIASAVFTGLMTDTGCFRYSNTKESTFLAAAYLSSFDENGFFYDITKRIFETKSRKQMKLEAHAVEKAEFYFSSRVGLLVFGQKDMQEEGITFPELDGIINVLRQTEGVSVSIVLKEKEKNVFKASVRSEKNFDAASFAARFGGGGHRAAAGFSIEGSAEEVKKAVLSALEETDF